MADCIVTRAEAMAQDLSTYITGRPCKHGHLSKRWTKTRACIACINAYHAKWYVKNKTEKLRKGRKWAVEHPEAVRSYSTKWRSMNPDAVKETYRAWAQKNPDKRRALDKKKYHAQPERYRSINNGWAARNPDKKAVVTSRRRARKAGARGTHTAADLSEILRLQGHRCAYCRASLKKVKKHLDHIVAISRGGANARSNLQYTCGPCNLSKKAKDPLTFARERGLLL